MICQKNPHIEFLTISTGNVTSVSLSKSNHSGHMWPWCPCVPHPATVPSHSVRPGGRCSAEILASHQQSLPLLSGRRPVESVTQDEINMLPAKNWPDHPKKKNEKYITHTDMQD